MPVTAMMVSLELMVDSVQVRPQQCSVFTFCSSHFSLQENHSLDIMVHMAIHKHQHTISINEVVINFARVVPYNYLT